MDHLLQWDLAQLALYLGQHLDPRIAAKFAEHNIDGPLLPYITTGHLQEMGIEPLVQRLKTKRVISALVAGAAEQKPEWTLGTANVDSNYISVEALALCQILLQSGRLRKGDDVKRLQDQFSKLRVDLMPLLRQAKESKPLPTPTMESAPRLALPRPHNPASQLQSHLQPPAGAPHAPLPASVLLPSPDDLPASLYFNVAPQLAPNPAANSTSRTPLSPSSRRFSSGSLLSMGVGKVADISGKALARFLPKPRLVELKTPPDEMRRTDELEGKGTKPLKQLKALSDDTCLKVLQQAMKRHHIPRDHWSKYVLVVCYGDKERILKLTEKPVLVFRELQEHGKNPAVMLRELAPDADSEYSDARLNDDIPGGSL